MSSHELFECQLRTDISAHITLAVVALFVTIFEFNICWEDGCWANVSWQMLKMDRNIDDYITIT